MILKETIQQVFFQLSQGIGMLDPEEYTRPVKSLSDASIGQHVRHIIELFLCLESGYATGTVNYERRERNRQIETDKKLATGLIWDIYNRIDRPDRIIHLEAEDYSETGEKMIIPSNYFRELVYNLEHTIHHMALIRVGITELSSIHLPEEFGVAPSTNKYRKQCVL